MRRTAKLRGDILNGVNNALSIASRVTDTIMQPYLWLADTNGQAVYKVDTVAASVVGAYASRPSGAAGNPLAFAVLQNGDAFVSPQPSGMHKGYDGQTSAPSDACWLLPASQPASLFACPACC